MTSYYKSYNFPKFLLLVKNGRRLRGLLVRVPENDLSFPTFKKDSEDSERNALSFLLHSRSECDARMMASAAGTQWHKSFF